MLWKRKLLIIITVMLASIIAGVVSYVVLQPVYEASTKLIVNNSKPTELGQLNLNDINFNIRLIDTYKEIVKTHAIMDLVAEEHPEFNLTGKQLIDKIQINTVNNSQVMTLKIEDYSYEKAAHIVNAVSKVFQREIPHIMTVDNVSILNEANPNELPAPIKPKPMLNIAIAFVVSLMAIVGVVFLLEYLDDTIKTERDIEDVLGLPTLAAIGKVKEADLTEASRQSVSSTKSVGETQHATINH